MPSFSPKRRQSYVEFAQESISEKVSANLSCFLKIWRALIGYDKKKSRPITACRPSKSSENKGAQTFSEIGLSKAFALTLTLRSRRESGECWRRGQRRQPPDRCSAPRPRNIPPVEWWPNRRRAPTSTGRRIRNIANTAWIRITSRMYMGEWLRLMCPVALVESAHPLVIARARTANCVIVTILQNHQSTSLSLRGLNFLCKNMECNNCITHSVIVIEAQRLRAE